MPVDTGKGIPPMTDTHSIPHLYTLACHGDGAEVRRQARRDLMEAFDASGWVSFGDFLRHHGLDIHAYFASAPIG